MGKDGAGEGNAGYDYRKYEGNYFVTSQLNTIPLSSSSPSSFTLKLSPSLTLSID